MVFCIVLTKEDKGSPPAQRDKLVVVSRESYDDFPRWCKHVLDDEGGKKIQKPG